MSIRFPILTILVAVCAVGPVQADFVSLSNRQPAQSAHAPTTPSQVASPLEPLASPGNGNQRGASMDLGPTQNDESADAMDFGPAPLFFGTVQVWREPGQIGGRDAELDLINSMGFLDNAQPDSDLGWADLAGASDGAHVAGSAPISGGDGFVIAPLPPGALMGLATLVMFGARRAFRNRRGPL
jgi:hypothetical protein